MKKIIFFWRELLATFWFVPVMLIIVAIIASIIFVSVDNIIDIPEDGWIRFFLVNDPDSARSILATMSGAMIGVAGTVFSVVLVALTLASSQFGPRLIKNFMYIQLNQIVLGSYIATYLYCLLVLNAVKESEGTTFIPSISIFIGILAAISNIILLIVFIHQIATSIQADKIVADISDFITNQIDTLYAEKMGEEKDGKDKMKIAPVIAKYEHTISIKAPANGYLQYLSSIDLFEQVVKEDSLLIVHYRPGNHITKGIELAELQCHTEWDEKAIEKLTKQFVIGKTKTPQQDLEYSIHQMVEIALRALSPGINDPYTAMSCIDSLSSTLSNLAESKFPSKYRLDEDGTPRIVAKTFDWIGVLDAAFNQIRQYATGSTAVLIRLMEGLTIVHEFARTEEQKQAILRHAKMVLNTGEQSIKEPNDLDDLKARAEIILN